MVAFRLGSIAGALCFGVAILLPQNTIVHADEPNANAASFATASNPERLLLDARQAYRGLMFSHMTIPVKPGTFTFVYPKWIPGEHGPTGPLHDISMVRVTANGEPLTWHRDQVDLYAFTVDVPNGVSSIDVDFNVLLNGNDTMSTNNLAIVNWNRVLFYQNDTNADAVFIKPSVILPAGWSYGTSLPGAKQTGDRLDFDVVSLNMLVDSPLDMGAYYRHITLWSGEGTHQFLDVFADEPEDLDFPSDIIDKYKDMVPEALALYGSRHWNVYHSLLTLSDEIGFEGIEHHQSSDDRASSDFLTSAEEQRSSGDLLTHEFSHSWNGKYRRPFDLIQPNFQTPEHTELLWVYEGMNQYLGDLLSFRMGIRKPKEYPEYLANLYAGLDYEAGRVTTPIIDITTGAPYYYSSGGDWGSFRRNSGDFYREGELIWLDADTIIRQLSGGKKSLDDFLHLFTEPAVTGPMVKPYTRADVEALLTAVQPYDWHGFFERYVYQISVHPPNDDFERAGWRLVYTDQPNTFEGHHRGVDDWYGLGLRVNGQSGTIEAVRPDSAAYAAGLGENMKIIAVNGQSFTGDVLQYSIKDARHSRSPLTLLIEQTGWVKTYLVNYHDGLRYPHLVRISGKPDMLSAIMSPHRKRP